MPHIVLPSTFSCGLNKSSNVTSAIFKSANFIKENPSKMDECEIRSNVLIEDMKRIESSSKLEQIKNLWSAKSRIMNMWVSKMSDISTTGFVNAYPEWYRAELNSVVNRMNMSFDSVVFNMEMHDSKIAHLTSPKPIKIKSDIEAPAEFDEEEFFDALEEQQ